MDVRDGTAHQGMLFKMIRGQHCAVASGSPVSSMSLAKRR
jgi:hypothetical protein